MPARATRYVSSSEESLPEKVSSPTWLVKVIGLPPQRVAILIGKSSLKNRLRKDPQLGLQSFETINLCRLYGLQAVADRLH
nr:hypothetical protein BaRGS_032663 [Batillaria attramentaria]